jgi:hypothetical protein
MPKDLGTTGLLVREDQAFGGCLRISVSFLVTRTSGFRGPVLAVTKAAKNSCEKFLSENMVDDCDVSFDVI